MEQPAPGQQFARSDGLIAAKADAENAPRDPGALKRKLKEVSSPHQDAFEKLQKQADEAATLLEAL